MATLTTKGHMEKGRRVKMAVDYWSKFTGQTGTVITKTTGLGTSYVIKWDDPTLETTTVMEKHLVTIDAAPAPNQRALRTILASLSGLAVDDSREALIRWLAHNDRNGCYTDEDCIGEGALPVTLDEAWELLAGVFEDDIEEMRAAPSPDFPEYNDAR